MASPRIVLTGASGFLGGPTAAEFVEIVNPTGAALPLDDVYLTDRADYYLLATGALEGVAGETAWSDRNVATLVRVLYGEDSPCVVPDEPIVHTETFFDTATCT